MTESPGAPPPVIEHRVQRDGGRLHVRDYPGTEPSFVLLHGFPDNSRIYDDLIPHLVSAGRRVVAIDFLGFGASDKVSEARYGFDQQLGDLEAVVAALELGRIIPVGHDAGGPTAVNFALAHPERTAAVCLMNAFYGAAPGLRVPEFIELFANRGLKALTQHFLASPQQFAWLLAFQRDQMQQGLSDPQKARYAAFLGPLIDQNFRQQPSAGPAFAAMTARLDDEIAANTARLLEVPEIRRAAPADLGTARSISARQRRRIHAIAGQDGGAPRPGRRALAADRCSRRGRPHHAGGSSGRVARDPMTTSALTSRTLAAPRHRTRYWDAGPPDGPLMIFVHGWPGLGLMWRAQLEAFADEGWRCIAPDMRGYGASSAPSAPEAYALSEIVEDMVELHDHLDGRPAVWVGHDWGSPVVGALAAHHPGRSRGSVLISVPYFPAAFALSGVLPLVDRTVYPLDEFPDGQWDYYRFYLTHFDQAVTEFEADIRATLSVIYRPGSPEPMGNVLPVRAGHAQRRLVRFRASRPRASARPRLLAAGRLRRVGRRLRGHRLPPRQCLVPERRCQHRYAQAAPDGGRLRQPVLFINGDRDGICDITRTRLGEPMRQGCARLSVTNLDGAHWLPLERKAETGDAIRSWLRTERLA